VKNQVDVGIEWLKTEGGLAVYQPSDADLEVWHKTIFGATQSFVRREIGDADVDSLIAALAEYRKNKK
jgi:hypothetical protein